MTVKGMSIGLGALLLALLLAACGGQAPAEPGYLVVSLSSEEAFDFATTQASFGAGLRFEGFVNDTDRVLAEVTETEAGRLHLVFLAESPFAGRLGRLVFQLEASGDRSVIVDPLRTGEDQEVPVTTEEEETQTPPEPRDNPDALDGRSAPAGRVQYQPEMANYPLGDLDQSGAVTLEDVLELKTILLGGTAPSDFARYHGDLVLDGEITFDDIVQLSAKATGAAPPTLYVAPREFRAEAGDSAYILLGNAGSGALPAVQVSGVRGDPPQEVTPGGAVGRVYQLTSDGTTTGVVFRAGEAGIASSLNNLLSSKEIGAASQSDLAERAADDGEFSALLDYLQGEGFTNRSSESARRLLDAGTAFADVYQAVYDAGGEAASLLYNEAYGSSVSFAIITDADGQPVEEVWVAEDGGILTGELSSISLSGLVCLLSVGPQQTDPTELCRQKCREDFCNMDFGDFGDLETPCKILAYIHCHLGAGSDNCDDPPDPPPSPACRSCGDPHLYSFDGLAYDFQAAGEFVLAESMSGDLVVQARQEPWGSSETVAINTAVAMNVAGDRVGVYAERSSALYVNSEATELSGSSLSLPNGGTVTNEGDLYLVTWPDGSVFSATLRGSILNIGGELAEARRGQMTGLLGDYDGDRADDIRTRDGALLEAPVDFADLYGDYGDSWRISQAESLFDYEAGEDTETYTVAGFPSRFVSADTLSEEDYEAARSICEAAGVTDPVALENCILDVATTGDESFAEDGLNVPESSGVLEVCPEPTQITGDIAESQTWGPETAGCANYLVEGRGFLQENVVLTIEPGTRVVFREDSGLYAFGENSALHAVGTAEDPIVFEGEESGAGYWRGLAFQSDSVLNELSHAVISGGGSFAYDFQDDHKSNIFVRDGRLKLSNTTVENSAGHGMKVQQSSSSLEGFAANRFAGNARSPVVLYAPLIGDLDSTTDYDVASDPNGEPYIRVDRDIEYVQTDQTWPRADVPYRFQDQHLIQAGEVTIAPGAVLEFVEGGALSVGDNGGALIADAEGGEAIVFRGTEAGPNRWIGLDIRSDNPKNELNNVVVSGGGVDVPGKEPANVYLSGGGATLELRNSRLTDSSGYGVYVQPGGVIAPADPESAEANNVFEDNALGSVGP